MKPIRILNLGAGVQSTTVALMGVKNWEAWHCSEALPYEPVGLIDYAIFADTQEEPHAVYEHLEWLKSQCQKFFSVLIESAGSLGQNLIEGIELHNKTHDRSRRFISIPAYTLDKAGNKGIIPRQCTSDFKVDVLYRVIRRDILRLNRGQRIPADCDLTQLMGLSYDEAGRIMRVKARDNPFPIVFPLFEMEMTRNSCKTWLAKKYSDREVPRSACVFCPYHSNAEWRAIRAVKEDWDRAVVIDRMIRESGSACSAKRELPAYVHKDCVPLDQADLDDSETKDRKKGQEMFGFLNECEGMCGV